jgi:polyisoprenoid-binding protein YceI
MSATNESSQVPTTSITTWKLDPEVSRVEFTTRMRLMFVTKVTVQGHFTDVAGMLTVDEHESINSRVIITIGTASLDTKNAARDKHLRSADFFDVVRHPSMTFTSQHIEALDQAAGHYRITGTLTIREVTHGVSLDAWNISPETAGNSQLKFRLTAVLDRRDWGISWSRPIQQIADEINLALTAQFVSAPSNT